MVTPQELIDLADHLIELETEIADRAAISRAYYAAFWHVRHLVIDRFGPVDEPGVEVHREVARVLDLWNPEAAAILSELRLTRNVADYNQVVRFSRALAEEGVEFAKWLLRVE